MHSPTDHCSLSFSSGKPGNVNECRWRNENWTTRLEVHASPRAAVGADLGHLGPGRKLKGRRIKPRRRGTRGELKSRLDHVAAKKVFYLRGERLETQEEEIKGQHTQHWEAHRKLGFKQADRLEFSGTNKSEICRVLRGAWRKNSMVCTFRMPNLPTIGDTGESIYAYELLVTILLEVSQEGEKGGRGR